VKKPRNPPLRLLSPIHKASRQVARHLESTCSTLDVLPPEGHLLTYLASYAPASVGELVRVFGFKGSTLTSMLDRLQERRLITRRDNPADRRSLLIDITAAGERVAASLRKQIEALEEDVLGRVSQRDLAGFRAVLDALGAVTEGPPTGGGDS
jgi:DNA-binding MarR family transcriptional regulator